YVACRIIETLVFEGVAVGAYKPVASGAPSLEKSDGFKLWQASGYRGLLADVTPQHFLAPFAPPVAAELENKQVSDDAIRAGARNWVNQCGILIVEGAGGLMSPLSWNMTNASLAYELQIPIVLVSENRLGVVNQVLTSLVAARSLGLRVCCIVLNEVQQIQDSLATSNEGLLRKFIEKYPSPPAISRLEHQSNRFEPAIRWSDFV
ncbi:MAG TPA: dethiobiotin synthase, partial [Pirellula sp.]|nr:dethiobiotin synthase [Pirellula sp.]